MPSRRQKMNQGKSEKSGWPLIKNLVKKPGLAFLIIFILTCTLKAAFQETLWGARPAGLAGAFTALADDANAPAYNPAGIALLNRSELTFMYAQLYSGLDLYAGPDTTKLGLGYFSFVPRIKDNKFGHFGVSWANFQATSLYQEDTFFLTYANSKAFPTGSENDLIFAYGANLKLFKRDFTGDIRTADDPVFANGSNSNALAADLGVIVRPNFNVLPGLKAGFAAQNINQPDIGLAATDRIPAKYTLGLAYQDRNFRLANPTLDISRRAGRTLVTAGWEGWFLHDAFAFRAGGNADELAGGLGYQFRLFDGFFLRLDYSLIWPLNVEGTNGSHRISLTTTF